MSPRPQKHLSKKRKLEVATTSDSDASDSDNSNQQPDLEVYTIGTDIYFQCDVTQKSIFKLIEQVKKLETKLFTKAIELPGYKPSIRIFIRTDGGDIYAGFGAMDHLLNSKLKITTIADGLCASAGTLMLLGGRKRQMRKHAFILIHQLTSGFWGKYTEIQDELVICTQLMDMLKLAYNEHTNIPSKKLKDLMKHDVFLTADECLEYGIVHSLACLDTA
jgi:ATP-dependent Clp endopeptidase proteolytic subunit ClpP